MRSLYNSIKKKEPRRARTLDILRQTMGEDAKTTVIRRRKKKSNKSFVDDLSADSNGAGPIDFSTPVKKKRPQVSKEAEIAAKDGVGASGAPEEEQEGYLGYFARVASSYVGYESPSKASGLVPGAVDDDEDEYEDDFEEYEEEVNVLDRINFHLNKYFIFRYLRAKTGMEEFEVAFAMVVILAILVLVIFGPRVLCNCVAFLYPCYASYKALERYALLQKLASQDDELDEEEDADERSGVGAVSTAETKKGHSRRFTSVDSATGQQLAPGVDATLEPGLDPELIDTMSDAAGDLRVWLTYWTCLGVFDVVERVADYLLFWMAYYEFLKIVFLLWLFIPRTDESKIGSYIVYHSVVEPALLYFEDSIDSWLTDVANTAKEAITEISYVSGGYIKKGITWLFGQVLNGNVDKALDNVSTPESKKA